MSRAPRTPNEGPMYLPANPIETAVPAACPEFVEQACPEPKSEGFRAVRNVGQQPLRSVIPKPRAFSGGARDLACSVATLSSEALRARSLTRLKRAEFRDDVAGAAPTDRAPQKCRLDRSTETFCSTASAQVSAQNPGANPGTGSFILRISNTKN